jgi:hypothetical protein
MAKFMIEIDDTGKICSFSCDGKVLYDGNESTEKHYRGAFEPETILQIGSILINKKLGPWAFCVPDGHGGSR